MYSYTTEFDRSPNSIPDFSIHKTYVVWKTTRAGKLHTIRFRNLHSSANYSTIKKLQHRATRPINHFKRHSTARKTFYTSFFQIYKILNRFFPAIVFTSLLGTINSMMIFGFLGTSNIRSWCSIAATLFTVECEYLCETHVGVPKPGVVRSLRRFAQSVLLSPSA